MRRIFFLSLILAACAQPRYADEAPKAEATNASLEAAFRDGVRVAYRWEQKPTDEDFGSFTFTTTRDGIPVDLNPAPAVMLWMASMGHGSSPVTVVRADVGIYRAENVFFTMHGDWQIRVQRKKGEEVQDEVVLPYTY